MYYADYLLNKKVRVQIQAFVEGLQMVIKKENLSIFFSDEIQLLISKHSPEGKAPTISKVESRNFPLIIF